MKRTLLLSVFLFITAFGYGQYETVKVSNSLNLGNFKIKKFYVSFGEDRDMVRSIGFDYFANQVPDELNFPFRDASFSDSELESAWCENPNLSLGFTLEHPAVKNIQWRNALNIINGRNDGVRYGTQNGRGDYLNFNATQNELALETALLYNLKLTRHFNLYGGLGTNIGGVTDNRICYSAYTEDRVEEIGSDGATQFSDRFVSDCFEGENQLAQRFFLEYGFSWVMFKRFELGLNYRKGFGYRLGADASTGTRLNGFNLSMGYILK